MAGINVLLWDAQNIRKHELELYLHQHAVNVAVITETMLTATSKAKFKARLFTDAVDAAAWP